MRRFLTLLFGGIFFLTPILSWLGAEEGTETRKPIPFIFDTDMGNDVDDALALAILHSLMSRGECDLLAVTLTKSAEKAADYVQFINEFYGRPEIPIGVVSKEITSKDGKYIGKLFELKDENGQPLFFLPKRGKRHSAVALLREKLTAADDHSVIIAQVGFSSNLAELLDSPADAISPLTGKELAAKKVKFISLMFGAFNYEKKDHREFNVVTDIPSAQKLVSEWPTEIHFSGYEIGRSVFMTSTRVKRDFGYLPHHPLTESFILYREGCDENQPTYDMSCILEAIRPEVGYFTLSEPGTVTVENDGKTVFTPDSQGRHRIYQPMTSEQIIRVEEAFYELSSEPPHKMIKRLDK